LPPGVVASAAVDGPRAKWDARPPP
jgi:hypothetical protein